MRWLLVVLLALIAPSQQQSTDPPAGIITNVYISVFVNSIAKLDGVEQSFSADFYLTAWWVDDRLDSNMTLSADGSSAFNPFIEFQNSIGGTDAQVNEPYSYDAPPSQAVLGFDPAGHFWAKMDQRFVGSFSSPLNLQEFPYDKQDLVLGIESELWDNTTVRFKKAVGLDSKMLPPHFEVIEWELRDDKDPFVDEADHYYDNFQQSYSRLEIHVPLKRQPDYYIFKIFLGSILLVLMSIAIYALGIDEPDRMMGTITVFLALISFLFVAGGSIPKIAYQTRLDNFMNFSFLVVFFMLISHAVNYIVNSVHEHKEDLASESASKMGVDDSKQSGHGEPTGPFRWFMVLSPGRKLDVCLALMFSVIYLIGVPVILLV